jgi:hypothetical protein
MAPEELESLLEDAFVLHDHEALAQLFEPEATLHPAGWARPARGRVEIERLIDELWDHQLRYVADPGTVLQSRGTALIISRSAINVVRRTPDGAWRYAIVYLRR